MSRMQNIQYLIFLGAMFAVPSKASNLTLNAAAIHPQYSQVTALLAQAYREIGVELTYTQLPYIRSAVNANVGIIDGLDLRIAAHAQPFINLVKVNVPLLTSKTIVVINRKLCPKCELGELRSLGAVSGFSFPTDDLNLSTHSNRLIELAEHHRLFTFFKGGRVNAIITSDLFLPDVLRNNDMYRYIEIARQPVYHYLYKGQEPLVAKLEGAINKLIAEREASGAYLPQR